jgi:hypothetical protein
VTASDIHGGTCLSNDNSCGLGNTNLTGFIGGANLFNVTISNIGTHNFLGGIYSTIDGTTNGSINLFYDYTVPVSNIPEPASLSLMGLCLAYLMIAQRKKISTANLSA